MPKRMLAIGVGGSGKAALTILKERMEETYGEVPDNVVLLSLDTDDLRDGDTFAGTRLSSQVDGRSREPEFRHVVSPPGMTMNTIFADIAAGRTSSYMYWLEKDKLDRILSPTERDIRGGAQQRRPVGRVALFLRWANSIYKPIVDGISRMYGEPEVVQAIDAVQTEQSKRMIFVIGSVAGGTGSGFFGDVLNLVRRAVKSNNQWQSVDVSAIVVLPEAFSSYTTVMQDPTNLKPNSYAALRELDRFIRTHSAALPYMIRYGEDINSITWSINQPVDHVYLVDTASRGATGDLDLSGNPMRGVFPVIADFVMAHIDRSLGDALATLRSNAGLHYDKSEGWQYSSFNVMTYIFPVDDVIESFSYRFLREMLTRQYLPLGDKKIEAQLRQGATREAERLFSQGAVGGKVNPTIVQKAIAATQPVNPEPPDMSWQGLFNLIALSDSTFAQDYQDLEQWMNYLTSNMIPTKVGEYKSESYEEGYQRLLTFGTHYLDECLGMQTDPEDEESRAGGQWDAILSRYPEALRLRFAEALDGAIIEVLNQRDPQSKVLAPSRLPAARAMVGALRERLIAFKQLLDREYRQLSLETQVRQLGTDVREAITRMHESQDKTFALFGKPEARRSQEAYIGYFTERARLLLHQRIYRTIVEILNVLGCAEQDSVLNQADLELETWQATLSKVDRLLDEDARTHEKHREEKRQVRVRRYLTNPDFEAQLYSLPNHSGAVALRVLGQVRGETGMLWQRLEANEPLSYKMVTVWTKEARGPEEIKRQFFAGIKGLFQVVRESVTIGDRIAAEFSSPASFVGVVNQYTEPFLRYNPAANGKTMFSERYVSFNLNKAQDAARRFLEQSRSTLGDQGINVDSSSEGLVACTVVEVARGVRLSAVEQFVACEPEYRVKLHRGRETIHLFPEEQVATDYEGRIETLGEPDNRQRTLSPELVVAMGDEAKIRAFTLACAYGLIKVGMMPNPETGEQRPELLMEYSGNGRPYRAPLSESMVVEKSFPQYKTLGADEQLRWLYLSALQNFALKATEKHGVAAGLVAQLVQDLQYQGVRLDSIHNPFTLPLKVVYEAINAATARFGPSESEETDMRRRQAENARRCAKHLQRYLVEVEGFKRSPCGPVRDLGTVMHLILQEAIDRNLKLAGGA